MLYISLLIAADVAVVLAFGAYHVRRLVVVPLRRRPQPPRRSPRGT